MVIGGSIFEPTDIFCIADELNRAVKKVDVYEEREKDHAADFSEKFRPSKYAFI